MTDFHSSFSRACAGIGANSSGAALLDQLLAAYAEPQRKYHTAQHLSVCLQLFDGVRTLAQAPAEVEMALWFHDAVYDVKASDNEAQSAQWAQRALAAAAVPPEVITRVVDLVMVTRHTGEPSQPDQRLLVDVDLAILGAEVERFAEYEQQIRDEYSFVPGWLFRRKRKAILRTFIERPRIYGTDHFYKALEQAARRNLAAAVK